MSGFISVFFQFLAEQWLLVGALLSCVFLLIFHESRRAGTSVSPTQLSQLVNRDEALVIDLRDSKEYKGGHIVDSRNVPFAKFEGQLGEFEGWKEKPVVLVCKLGTHSSSAGKIMAGKGFQKVHRLGGGMAEWQAQQLPLVQS